MSDGAYRKIITKLFVDRYKSGATKVSFGRDDIATAAAALRLNPKNLGDVVYSFRFRANWPEEITRTAPAGKQWVIVGEGAASYAFSLFGGASIAADPNREAIKVPRATPEIVTRYVQTDEQALLAVVRYNRLVDLFLGVTAYSLQNHLRTQVAGIGQLEIDELYVGVNASGAHFIIPVQAKGGKDKQGVSQVLQDHEFCKAKYPALIPRLIAAQFCGDDQVVMMELVVSGQAIKKRNEAHYRIVPESAITEEELRQYRTNSRAP